MQAQVRVQNTATCEICGRIFKEVRRRYYCEHCAKYYYVCPTCKANVARCTYCGIPLKQKSEPKPFK